MAHDFSIKVKSEVNSDGDAPRAYFFGYGDGAMYKAFGVEQYNACLSGGWHKKIITKNEAVAGLRLALELLSDYPDPNRTKGLSAFLAEHVETAPVNMKFEIHFRKRHRAGPLGRGATRTCAHEGHHGPIVIWQTHLAI